MQRCPVLVKQLIESPSNARRPNRDGGLRAGLLITSSPRPFVHQFDRLSGLGHHQVGVDRGPGPEAGDGSSITWAIGSATFPATYTPGTVVAPLIGPLGTY